MKRATTIGRLFGVLILTVGAILGVSGTANALPAPLGVSGTANAFPSAMTIRTPKGCVTQGPASFGYATRTQACDPNNPNQIWIAVPTPGSTYVYQIKNRADGKCLLTFENRTDINAALASGSCDIPPSSPPSNEWRDLADRLQSTLSNYCVGSGTWTGA